MDGQTKAKERKKERKMERDRQVLERKGNFFIPMHHIDEKMSNNFIDAINFS